MFWLDVVMGLFYLVMLFMCISYWCQFPTRWFVVAGVLILSINHVIYFLSQVFLDISTATQLIWLSILRVHELLTIISLLWYLLEREKIE